MFFFFFFFLNDTAPTEIYPLPLHDALPIWRIDHPASLTNGPPRTAETTARAAMMPSVTTLIGSHTTRPVQPWARRRATSVLRVVTAGSNKLTMAGASSKCTAHHAIALAQHSTSHTAI